MFFHNSSKIEYRWISLDAFEISSAIMTQSRLASRRSVIAMISCAVCLCYNAIDM